MSRFTTGPWLRAARFEGGLLVPGRPGGRSFDLLLTPEHAVIRGSGELVLPWPAHLDFARSEVSSEGWFVTAWGGRGGGAAIHLQGRLKEQSQALPLMQSWLARWASTPIGGARAPLDRLTPFERPADKDVLHALCTTLAARADLRPRLGDARTVGHLLSRIVRTPHGRGYPLGGARRVTVETGNALRTLGYVHAIGGRPLPDMDVPRAEDLLPDVLGCMRANRYAPDLTYDESVVLALIERGYTRCEPWPFEPLFD